MKKLSILFAGLLVSAMIFTSCSKEDDAVVTVTTGKATIEGYVYMDWDDDGAPLPTSDSNYDTKMEYAPSGTEISITIDTDELTQDGTTGTHPDKIYKATVDANGKYSISIDAGARNVTADIRVVDVYKERTRWEANYSTTPTTYDLVTETRTYWTGPTATVTLNQNHKAIQDLNFGTHIFVQD